MVKENRCFGQSYDRFTRQKRNVVIENAVAAIPEKTTHYV
jgi:hypothetical protein